MTPPSSATLAPKATAKSLGKNATATSAARIFQAQINVLATTVGHDLRVPLADGRKVRHVNFDYAATAPALDSVAQRVAEVLPWHASIHRGAGPASRHCTALYEQARQAVAQFSGARHDDVVVFTRNTTDSLNLLAACVPDGAEVKFFDLEHHANLLPWRRVAHQQLETAATVDASLKRLQTALEHSPGGLVAFTGASNVTGELLPVQRFVKLAHAYGARVVVDAAQLAPHGKLDLAGWGADYLVFSGHKLYAPYGAGVLVGRRDWLDAADPYLDGGGAVKDVRADAVDWAAAPERHEGGTPNLLGAVAIAQACQHLGALGAQAIAEHETALRDRLLAGLAQIEGVRLAKIFSDDLPAIGLVSFTIDGFETSEISSHLAEHHAISVRDGRFCAHQLLHRLGVGGGAVRASFGVGTTSADVDSLLWALAALARKRA